MTNKSIKGCSTATIVVSKGELKIPVSTRIPIPGDDSQSAKPDPFFLSKCTFPVEMQYGTKSFQGVPTRKVFQEATQNLGYMKFRIKIDKPEGFRPRYRQECGTQILVESSFEVYAHLGWVINVTVRTPFESSPIAAESFSICSGILSYNNSRNQYQKINELAHYRVQEYYSVFQFCLASNDDKIDCYDLHKLYSILDSGNVYIKLGDIRCYLHQEQIDYFKRCLIINCAIDEVVLDDYKDIYEGKKDSWLTAKGFDSEANKRFMRRNEVGEFTVSQKSKKAFFIGHLGDRYRTTLRSCTCEDFKERDRVKGEFVPCKHMFRLATELGYFKGLSRLPMDRSTSSFLELLQPEDTYDYPCGFSYETCEPWKMPLCNLLIHSK